MLIKTVCTVNRQFHYVANFFSAIHHENLKSFLELYHFYQNLGGIQRVLEAAGVPIAQCTNKSANHHVLLVLQDFVHLGLLASHLWHVLLQTVFLAVLCFAILLVSSIVLVDLGSAANDRGLLVDHAQLHELHEQVGQ